MSLSGKSLHSLLILIVLQACVFTPLRAEDKSKADNRQVVHAAAVMWQQPTDIKSRDLFYGPGGRENAPPPKGPFTFLEEDTGGYSPKFDVIDGNGVRWKVKLGDEVGPETAATRLLWAVGYFADADYFMP